jgi:hypothetical protein
VKQISDPDHAIFGDCLWSLLPSTLPAIASSAASLRYEALKRAGFRHDMNCVAFQQMKEPSKYTTSVHESAAAKDDLNSGFGRRHDRALHLELFGDPLLRGWFA